MEVERGVGFVLVFAADEKDTKGFLVEDHGEAEFGGEELEFASSLAFEFGFGWGCVGVVDGEVVEVAVAEEFEDGEVAWEGSETGGADFGAGDEDGGGAGCFVEEDDLVGAGVDGVGEKVVEVFEELAVVGIPRNGLDEGLHFIVIFEAAAEHASFEGVGAGAEEEGEEVDGGGSAGEEDDHGDGDGEEVDFLGEEGVGKEEEGEGDAHEHGHAEDASGDAAE